MYVKDLFEAVQVDTPCTQPKFLSYLHITIQNLIAKYGDAYVTGRSSYHKALVLDTDIAVADAYFPAIVSNIAFMVSGNEARKVDYVEEADSAYRAVYAARHGRGKFLARGYYDV